MLLAAMAPIMVSIVASLVTSPESPATGKRGPIGYSGGRRVERLRGAPDTPKRMGAGAVVTVTT